MKTDGHRAADVLATALDNPDTYPLILAAITQTIADRGFARRRSWFVVRVSLLGAGAYCWQGELGELTGGAGDFV